MMMLTSEHEQDCDLIGAEFFFFPLQVINNVEQHNRMKRTRRNRKRNCRYLLLQLLMSEKEERLTNGDSCLGPTRSNKNYLSVRVVADFKLVFPLPLFFFAIISMSSSAKPAKKRGADLHLPAPKLTRPLLARVSPIES